ncbi:MAG: 16S rRNA (cytosine(967)-C(5))-methyltransferase RsmB [Oscillospiraceae bacterium]|nr:16S rRNA (cytosine(967)-C(5))-methyltransferase RsmB [Oscillospiraceae bacterium]
MRDPRQIAANALLDVQRRAAWSNLSLDTFLRRHPLPPAGAAFASALFYGVIERRLTLDACIAAHAAQPPEKLSPEVLTALRLGIYQLLYLDVPDHAAVAESVELARKLRKPQAAGFVNGVLRAFLRSGKAVPLPEAPVARLSLEFSCPEPLVELLLENYGDPPAHRFLADSLGRPPVTIRVNTLRIDSNKLIDILECEGVRATPHQLLADCLLLEQTGSLPELKSYRDGLFHVQDVSSQLAVHALNLRPGMRVLDTCAAPGGKTFTAAQLLEGKGEVVACDLHEKRVGLIARRAQEMGLTGITTLCRDMSGFHPDLGEFDAVLCDMPCSGYGVIRRKPEIKYKPLNEFANISNTQYNILVSSAKYCKGEGSLLYSTCTFNPAENVEVTERFAREHPAFSPRPLGGLLGGDTSRTLLAEFGGDGFYLAAFHKGGNP